MTRRRASAGGLVLARITSDEFDTVAAELSHALDAFNVPEREKQEVLAAFAAHKDEVTEGSRTASAAVVR